MKLGETAEVIRHTITLNNGKSFILYQNPPGLSIAQWTNQIPESKMKWLNPSISFEDIHGEIHSILINQMAQHSMKMVKVTMKAADPNPLNENYGEDEVS